MREIVTRAIRAYLHFRHTLPRSASSCSADSPAAFFVSSVPWTRRSRKGRSPLNGALNKNLISVPAVVKTAPANIPVYPDRWTWHPRGRPDRVRCGKRDHPRPLCELSATR
jgi:hypothetical protein